MADTILRLATFNLENLDEGGRGASPLDARLAVLRPQLERLDADILCLQEVHGQKPAGGASRGLLALERLVEGTPYAAFHRASTSSTGRHAGGAWVADIHNLVVLSRFPVACSEEVRERLVEPPSYRLATADPPEEAAQPCSFERPLLHVAVRLPCGRLLHLVNLHLRAPLASVVPGQKESAFCWRSVPGWAEGFFVSTVKRAAQALEARLLVDTILDAEPGALIAVVGDCNAEDRTMPLRLLAAETADTGNGALAARSLVPLERSLPADRCWTVIHHGRRVMLDHILVSRTLLGAFRTLEIHNETLGDELEPAQGLASPTESYHAPMVASFAFAGSKSR
ncbi:endonuclease/exonuclease/phosphatase family protein [Marinimicrococcus flavescens]|uniref:Endonuclease/exonuclease/phosphatase family protein n=1 Tax=Marinimicrococcus flavescens TaxID=3031815 RepID=A0AAP3XPJ0_9PROT|nr:endonuclease/exonuclease/phosphatase family protein [Marinimicrococcus flavescens]